MIKKNYNKKNKSNKRGLFLIKLLTTYKNHFLLNVTNMKFLLCNIYLNNIKNNFIKCNLILIQCPLLISILSIITIFIFNISIAHCDHSGDWAGNRIPSSLPENTGLFEAAKANRNQSSSNFNDYLPKKTGLLEAAVANRNQCSANLNDRTSQISFNDDSNNIVNENLQNDLDILTQLKVSFPSLEEQEPFYTNIEGTKLLLEGQNNIVAMNIANQLSYEIVNIHHSYPEKELKFLIHERLQDHDTKNVWGLGLNQNNSVMASKIVGYNYSTIHDGIQHLSIEEKIIRAHINVQIALQNISVQKQRFIEDLLNNESLYDHLLEKQFIKAKK